MLHLKLIKYLYIVLTVLAVICPIDIPFLSFLPGIILMWLFYFVFHGGIFTRRLELDIYTVIVKENKGNRLTLFIAIAYLIFYPFYIKFYTGLDIITTMQNLFSGVSNYMLYQSHFSKEGLSQMAWGKLPLIITHGFLRFLFIGSVFKSIIYKDRPSYNEVFSISLMVAVILFVGIARGTSYEFFELFLIFFFAIVTKRALSGREKLISHKMLIKISITSSIILIVFLYNIHIRMGESFSFFNHPDFDKHSLVYIISKPIALVLFPMYEYFLFGLHFTSVAITKLWFSSMTGFISMIIPNGIHILGISHGYRDFVDNFINIGTRWTPDTIMLINSYGIVIAFVIVYFIGRFSRSIYTEITNNLHASILLFFCFYYMFSLPVGNFISTSSANLLTILFALVFYKFKTLSKLFFNI